MPDATGPIPRRSEPLAEKLRSARDLIAEPERWTQGVAARDRIGAYVEPHGPDAVCWCAQGAVFKAFGGYTPGASRAVGLLDDCAEGLGFHDVLDPDGHGDADTSASAALNDGSDHPLVLRMFECAISKTGVR